MLLSSVIIVLREVIEAALLFSILTALSKLMGFKLKWIAVFLIFGIAGSFFYALNIHTVSDWFDGVGQEVVNAFIQINIYLMLLLYLMILLRYVYINKVSSYLLIFVLFFISTLAITREGSEIILYFYSVTSHENHISAVFVGMLIGASIGISLGFLFYYVLVGIDQKLALIVGFILILLIGAGMISQASLLLIQADWLEAQLPLWNMSSYLSEKSITGQLLYALIGYEATPTAIQFGLYLLSLFIPILLYFAIKIKYTKKSIQEI